MSRHHSLLWPNATTFEWSQPDYLQPMSATVPCDQRPHHLKNHNGQDAQQHCCLYKDIPWIATYHGDVAHFHPTLKWVLQHDSTLTWISSCPWVGKCSGEVVHCLVTQVEEIRRVNTNLSVFYDFKATMRTYFNFWVEYSVPLKSQGTDQAFTPTTLSRIRPSQ